MMKLLLYKMVADHLGLIQLLLKVVDGVVLLHNDLIDYLLDVGQVLFVFGIRVSEVLYLLDLDIHFQKVRLFTQR